MTTTASEKMEFGEREGRLVQLPSQPRTVEETGVNFLFLVELLVKTLFIRGRLRLIDLTEHLKLPFGVLDQLLSFMRAQHLCEVIRAGETETSAAYNLSESGRFRAQDFLQKSQYSGPAPVSLDAYVQVIHQQTIAEMRVTHEDLHEAFRGIVIGEKIVKQFGAAMNSGGAIFVYGPPGSGKTYISEQLVRLLSGNVAIPYAIVVDNEVIQLFDPLLHEPVAVEHHGGGGLDRGANYDERWVLCRRPVVRTGGELTLSMLDLDFDPTSRFYHAPPQVKANNGLLIIDDLGRQLTPAFAIMNRWIVPLDRHVDYLALHTGKKFMLPFDMVVVFSTNLLPSDLADEAFLRRLGYKIYIGSIDESQYREIAKQVCGELDLPYTEAGMNYLLDERHRKEGKPLLACIPRDILRQVRDIALYQGIEPELTPELLDWAWGNYYARDYQ